MPELMQVVLILYFIGTVLQKHVLLFGSVSIAFSIKFFLVFLVSGSREDMNPMLCTYVVGH